MSLHVNKIMYDDKRIQNACEYLVTKSPEQSCDYYRVGLAVDIVRAIGGLEWANQILFPNNHGNLDKVNTETVSHMESRDLGFNFQEKTRYLACALYSLQPIKNFKEILTKIQNGDRKLGYLAEIEAGYFLTRRSIEFEYIKPTGEKGSDFDIKIENSINCEVKHKLESTDFSEKGLDTTLSRAKDQVPENEPSLFFIKIPNEWTRGTDWWEKISERCDNRFGKSINIVGIMFMWQREIQPGVYCWMFRFKGNDFNPEKDIHVDLVKKLNLSSKELWSSNLVDDSVRKYIKKCESF